MNAPVGEELDVLLAVARLETGVADEEPLRDVVQRGVEWARVLPLASRHGLMPLLYHHLPGSMDLVPETVLRALQQQIVEIGQRSLLQTAELANIVRLLAEHRITAIPYKGPALAAQLYGSVLLRECCDLDLLVDQRDVWRAATLLRSLGYVPARPLAEAQRRAYAASECDVTLVHARSGLSVELHWAVAPPYFSVALSAADLLSRIEWVDLMGSRIAALAPEDSLLVLCINASKERWTRLEWTCAVAQTIRRRAELDWIDLAQTAARLGVDRILKTGLRLAHELLRAPVPAALIRQATVDPKVTRLVAQVRGGLSADGMPPSDVWALTRFRLSSRERWRDRARHCVLRVVTPTHRDLEAVRLPPSLGWLRYGVRPLRLLAATGSATARRLTPHARHPRRRMPRIAVKLGVPTLVCSELLDRLLESAERGAVKPAGYVIVDNGGRYGRARAEAIVGRRAGVTLEVITPGVNLGVAASWNRILDLAGHDPIVISNDDVILDEHTFAEMARALERALFVAGDGWALFGQRPECTRLVGPYDENFWPAYYEDVDYDIRLRRAGITPVRPLSRPLRHDGWATTRRLEDASWLSDGRERNRRYLIAKWGAETSAATMYREPFDGHPPARWRERTSLPRPR